MIETRNNTENDYDYIVIGSGFGGSVSALRLAEKGYKVAVIERGKRYKPEEFAVTNWKLRKYLWMPRFGFFGIQVMTWLKHVFILSGSGVGGGSLVYANNLLMPDDEVFRKKEWGNCNFGEKLKPFYEKARKMLGAVPSPTIGKADMALSEVCKEMTGSDTFHINDVGVFFAEKPGEDFKDPYFSGLGPDRKSCTFCAACMVGCRENAKNTLDKNYLYFAEKFGAAIIPEMEVMSVRSDGKDYEITVRKTSGIFRKKYRLQTRGVILCGGVLGTVKLLLACKNNDLLQGLSEQTGNFVRTNAEALIGILARDKKAEYCDNTAITSGVYPDKNTHIEIVRYNKGSGAIGALASLYIDGSSKMPRFLKVLTTFLQNPYKFIKYLFPKNFGARCSILLVMQTVEGAFLKLTYRRRLKRFGGKSLDSELPAGMKKTSAYIPVAQKIMMGMSRKMDAVPMSLWTETLFDIPTTAHILGGAIMSDSPETGVVDFYGKVHGFQNLYIADGSVIPANLGVNPSLTITAIAEYIMSGIPEKPGNQQKSLENLMEENKKNNQTI